ncbi:alpha/beta fold hydrolase [Limibacillus halophilus]|uniref:3-oxoadipate enol-lactonase n=1 Tax=Limibacillus halophilus TaxID=1579333 RepID=A0A839SRU8_9PROT|nr:alpha/beta fold hydrolase [Limibacillus halophilus]MBB3064514.1 3-oxoadipate enol-lactonase [Limibacillus halophilus]
MSARYMPQAGSAPRLESCSIAESVSAPTLLEGEESGLQGGTYYRVVGQGPTVLLAHGLGHDLTLWDRVAASLAPRFRVVRFDLLGHGRSAKPPGPYTLDSFLRQFDLLDRQVDLRSAHLVGHAAGALLCLRRGLIHQHSVSSALLLHPFARPPLDEGATGMPELPCVVRAMRRRCDSVILQCSTTIFQVFWQDLSKNVMKPAFPVEVINGASDPQSQAYEGPMGQDLVRMLEGANARTLTRMGTLSPLTAAEEIVGRVFALMEQLGSRSIEEA